MPDEPRRPAVRRKPERGAEPAGRAKPDAEPPDDVLGAREVVELLRRRNRAVRRKWDPEGGEPERLPHPFDEP